MGVPVMLLVFLVGPTSCAQAQLSGCSFSIMLEQFVHQIDAFFGGEKEMKSIQNIERVIEKVIEKVRRRPVITTKYATGYTDDVYVPKSPRHPIIMVWPSVMNPAVTNEVAKEINRMDKSREYLKLECDNNWNDKVPPITLDEIRAAIYRFNDSAKASRFFRNCVPELILWLSDEALLCGFYTIYKREREQIYRFISYNRHMWIKALQEVVYILLQTIAVIHHKTNKFGNGPVFGSLNWLRNWTQSYELWFEHYREPIKYFQSFILNSLDIVMAWLFDYLAKRTDVRENYYVDDAIVCALENYDMVPALDWEFMLDKTVNKLKMMADTFLKCEVQRGCEYRGPVQVFIGEKGSDQIVRIPSPKDCTLSCNVLPEVKDVRVESYSFVEGYSVVERNFVAYSHAHMTTAVGHELYCNTKSATKSASVHIDYDTGKTEVDTECYPLIVETYIKERQYKICKSGRCKLPCCKPFYKRPATQRHCEIVTNEITVPAYQITSNTTLTKDMTDFPDLRYLR